MNKHDEQDLQSSSAPSCLSDHGQAVWARLSPVLRAAGRLKQTDAESFTRYCDMVGRYWKMAEQVNTEGEVYWVPTVAMDGNEPGKMLRRHPLLTEMKSLLPEIRQIEDRFGMSPLARENLTNRVLSRVPAGDGELPFDQPVKALDRADPSAFH